MKTHVKLIFLGSSLTLFMAMVGCGGDGSSTEQQQLLKLQVQYL